MHALRRDDIEVTAAYARLALDTRPERGSRYGVRLDVIRAQALDVMATVAEARGDYARAAEVLQSAWETLYVDPDESVGLR